MTVDNGIAAKEEVSYLESLGIDLVVTDHHEPSDQVPQGVPLTDPKLEDGAPRASLPVPAWHSNWCRSWAIVWASRRIGVR